MSVRILIGDCREQLRTLPDESVHCVVTSPPYWGLRDYGVDGQIGLEGTFEAFIEIMVSVFGECRRVLRSDGTLWLNLGDTYANDGKWGGATGGKHTKWLHGGETRIGREKRRSGLKPKDLVGIPWRVALALQADGWWLRSDIIWHKPNPMPESITDRPTSAHEHVFLFAKSERYYYDADAVRERAEWGMPNSPGSIASPYGQGFTRRAGKNEESIDHRKHGLKDRWAGKVKAPHGQAGTDYDRLNARQDDLHNKIGRKGNAKGFRGRSYVGGAPGPRTETGNSPNETMSRNLRNVWTVATVPFPDAHFATFPSALIEPCIKAGCPIGGTVLDPFGGAGTTGLVADRLKRDAILIELNPAYAEMARKRIAADAGMFADVVHA